MAECRATCKRSGKPCQRHAIAGATVCRVHGGAAPQVKEAARLRLLALVDPALATLSRAVRSRGKPGAVQIAAARDILDRAGLAAPTKSELALTGNERNRLEIVFVGPATAARSKAPGSLSTQD